MFSAISLCATMVTKATTKEAIRKEIANNLKSLTREEKQRQSKIVFEKVKTTLLKFSTHMLLLLQLINLPSFQNCKRVSTYLSIDNEIDTEPIVRKIFETGKECFVPR